MIAGKTIISEDVFTELAKTAMAKVDGIVTTGNQKNSLASIARIVADKVAPQITVKKVDNIDSLDISDEDISNYTVSFELKISILYGQIIPTAANKIRRAIKDEIEDVTGYKIGTIDITVDKLVKPDIMSDTTTTTTATSGTAEEQ